MLQGETKKGESYAQMFVLYSFECRLPSRLTSHGALIQKLSSTIDHSTFRCSLPDLVVSSGRILDSNVCYSLPRSVVVVSRDMSRFATKLCIMCSETL